MAVEVEVVGRLLHRVSWNLDFKLIFEGNWGPHNGSQFSCIFCTVSHYSSSFVMVVVLTISDVDFHPGHPVLLELSLRVKHSMQTFLVIEGT